MKFTKMQGLGNDYVYVNCFEEKIENPSELAVKVSDSRKIHSHIPDLPVLTVQ